MVFTWDGIHYLYSSIELEPPTYRFQAVQDADRYFLMGEYEKALELYQDVIFSEKLDWWSPEKQRFIGDSFFANMAGIETPTPPPSNNDEYFELATYARYRIVLHHLARGWISDANITYTTLIEKSPEGSPGYPYASMATILWNEYQKSSSLELSCISVIDFVQSHPEILDVLGSYEHGSQSHRYVSEDVCPFK